VVAAVANGPRGLLFLSRFEQFLRALADEGVCDRSIRNGRSSMRQRRD
jgi:hypothetical protein